MFRSMHLSCALRLGVGGKLILKRVLLKQGVRMWAGVSWLGPRRDAGLSFSMVNKPYGSIQGEDSLCQLSNCQFLNKYILFDMKFVMFNGQGYSVGL